MKNKAVRSALISLIALLIPLSGCVEPGVPAETSAETTNAETAETTALTDETVPEETTDGRIGHIGTDDGGYTVDEFTFVGFSKEAGFYGEGFDLTLSAPKGYAIYYTLDGSDPVEYGTKYESPINLGLTWEKPWGETTKAGMELIGGTPAYAGMPGGYTVRAYATNGTDRTQVTTNTYFIIPGYENGMGVTVMNLSLNVADFISTDKGAYYTYQYDLWGTRPRSAGYAEVFDKNGRRVGNSYLEFAVSGNGSSGLPMKSLRMYYKKALNEQTGNPTSLSYKLFGDFAIDRSGRTIDSFSRILIRNSGNDYAQSYIRDAFCQRLAIGTNVDSMASDDMLFFVNGEFWGLYNVRERYSPEYYASHYGVDKDNVVMVENISPLANNDWNSDYVLSQGVEGDEQDWLDLFSYIYDNNPADEEVYRNIEARFDIDSYIDYWIFNVYLGNNDWPGNNIKAWRNKNPDDPSGVDTKWRYCLLDMDFALELGSSITDNLFDSANRGTKNGAIMHQLQKNEEFCQKLALRGYYLVENVFAPEHSIPMLDGIASSKMQYLSLQYARWGGNNGTFTASVQQMKDFLNQRRPYFMQYLCRFTGTTEEWMAENADRSVDISFQPEKVALTVNGREINRNGEMLAVPTDAGKIEISAEARDGYTVSSIEFIRDDGVSTVYGGDAGELTIPSSGTLYIHTKANS